MDVDIKISINETIMDVYNDINNPVVKAEHLIHDGKACVTNASIAGRKKRRRRRKAGEHHPGHKHRYAGDWEDTLTRKSNYNSNDKNTYMSTSINGQPMAPKNTNEFLMADQGLKSTPSQSSPILRFCQGGDCEPISNLTSSSGSVISNYRQNSIDARSISESGTSAMWSSDDDSLKMDDSVSKDFIKAYENYRSERLEAMSKDNLVKECLRLEADLDSMKHQVARLKKEIHRSKQKTRRSKSHPITTSRPGSQLRENT